MVDIVHGRGEQRRQLLERREHRLERRRAQQHAGRLHHVGGVGPVVVGHLPQVVALQSHHEGDEGAGRYLEGGQQVSILRELRWDGLSLVSMSSTRTIGLIQ